MNSNCLCTWVREVIVNNRHEIVDNVFGRSRTVDEEEIIVCYATISKMFLIVFLFVQSDHSINTELFENLNVF